MGALKSKQITESELFKKVNILVSDRNKEQLESLKDRASLLANMRIDNSALIRGMLDYFDQHPDDLKKIIPHVTESKGFNILQEFQEMIHENKSLYEIEDKLGISIDIIKKVEKKLQED